jgi:tRNA G10  N-methylase Trm11
MATIEQAFREQLRQMADALAAKNRLPSESTVKIHLADSTAIPVHDTTIDAVLTSPPYCTRIDYTASTRFELAILHGLFPLSHVDLGRRMLGSVRVPQGSVETKDSWGEECLSFLNKVASHASKASASYYLKTHIDYYDKLDRSIGEVSRVLKNRGSVIMVVQDSFYKDIHNDLPKMVADIASSHSLSLRQKRDFKIKRSMAAINRKSMAYRDGLKTTESVLCFYKD